MIRLADTRRRCLLLWGAACAGCLWASGCGHPASTAGVLPSTASPGVDVAPQVDATSAEESSAVTVASASEESPAKIVDRVDVFAEPVDPTAAAPLETPAPLVKDRTFALEGPDGALRVGFDDLDLLKLLKMEPVTADCVEKMPGWLRGLNGKKVRIRGFMKPGLLLENIPQFMFVRDTGLCCFGPKGKIYDMIAVTLKPGVTTEYIELRAFDVVGTFRIEVLQLDDGMIFGLYYLEDAVIVQK